MAVTPEIGPILFDNENNYFEEYISSMSFGTRTNVFNLKDNSEYVLPRNFDDLTQNLRWDIYETMMLDPQVKSAVGVLKAGILGGGMDIISAGKTAKDGDVVKFLEEVLFEHLETPLLSTVLPDMLRAIAVGNCIAEKSYYPMTGVSLPGTPIKNKMVLRSIKPKPRNNVGIVVDKFMNVTGIADQTQAVYPQIKINREKFVILSWKMENNDPRGTSELRAAYESWWEKRQLRRDNIKCLAQFAAPSLIGITAELATRRPETSASGTPVTDSAGNIVYSDPANKMLAAMEKFKNSSILVIPNGASVAPLAVENPGSAFLEALMMNNLEITKSILYQILATESVKNQTRAAASVAQDIMAFPITLGCNLVEEMIEKDMFRQLVELNYPVGTRVPHCKLPGANKNDFLAWSSAIAKMAQVNYLHPSQYAEIDAMLNLPPRSLESINEAIQKRSMDNKITGGNEGNQNTNKQMNLNIQ